MTPHGTRGRTDHGRGELRANTGRASAAQLLRMVSPNPWARAVLVVAAVGSWAMVIVSGDLRMLAGLAGGVFVGWRQVLEHWRTPSSKARAVIVLALAEGSIIAGVVAYAVRYGIGPFDPLAIAVGAGYFALMWSIWNSIPTGRS